MDSPRSSWWPGHPALVLETPEHWVEGQRSILHNGEARRKGWPRWLGGLRSTEEEPFHRPRQSPQPPGWGRGVPSLSPPGHLRGETKGGQGMGDRTGDRSCWSWSVKPFPNALCRVQFYVQIGDIWPEETPSNPAGPSQCLPRGDLAGPHTPYFRACLLVGGGYTGTYFSPWVPEVYLISQREGLWSIPHLWGLPSPYLSPWESLGGHVFPLGTMGACLPLPRLSGEPVFLPGFLGGLKACQSWATSLPREGSDL